MVSLAAVPSDIKLCFRTLTGAPMPGEMSKKRLMDLVAKLRKSEVAKSHCGSRLINLYEVQAEALKSL